MVNIDDDEMMNLEKTNMVAAMRCLKARSGRDYLIVRKSHFEKLNDEESE